MENAKILLVEDEKFVQAALVEFLRLAFPQVRIKVVDTLKKAREAWSQEKFDLIISDCVLPDGLACDFLEGIDFSGPTIILTGMVDPQKLKKAEKVLKGPFFLLKKPVSLEKLAQVVAPYLTRAS